MTLLMFPLPLAQIEGLFAIIFFLIAFIGWIINLANQQQQPPQRGRRPQAGPPRPGAPRPGAPRPGAPRPGAPQPGTPQRRPVQSEIDEFLKENRRGRERQAEREFVPGDEIEIVEPPRKRPGRRPPAGQSSSRSKREIWEEQTRGRDAGRPARSGSQGKPIQPGQASPPGRRGAAVTDAAAQRLPHPLEQRPRASREALTGHFGEFAAGRGSSTLASGSEKKGNSAAAMLGLMRSRQGARSAILLSEILSKPRALRRR